MQKLVAAYSGSKTNSRCNLKEVSKVAKISCGKKDIEAISWIFGGAEMEKIAGRSKFRVLFWTC